MTRFGGVPTATVSLEPSAATEPPPRVESAHDVPPHTPLRYEAAWQAHGWSEPRLHLRLLAHVGSSGARCVSEPLGGADGIRLAYHEQLRRVRSPPPRMFVPSSRRRVPAERPSACACWERPSRDVSAERPSRARRSPVACGVVCGLSGGSMGERSARRAWADRTSHRRTHAPSTMRSQRCASRSSSPTAAGELTRAAAATDARCACARTRRRAPENHTRVACWLLLLCFACALCTRALSHTPPYRRSRLSMT
jgi:hypothetical protein